MDKEKTKAWLEAIAAKALEENRNRNPSFINDMARKSPAIAHYFNNVAFIPAMTFDQWTQQCYPQMVECNRVREEYDALQEAVANSDKVKTLESKFDALQAKLTEFMEAQAAKPAPAKTAPKKDAVTDDATAADTEA